MTVIIHPRLHPQPVSRAKPRIIHLSTKPVPPLFGYSIRSSWLGGFGILFLHLIGLIPPPDNMPVISLAILTLPGFLVVSLCTGLLACLTANDEIMLDTPTSGRLGWMAGYWAGIFGGIVAMVMAAAGIYLPDFGHNAVNQFDPETLKIIMSYGLTAEDLALIFRVVGALVTHGIIGSLIAALCGALGGIIYPSLSERF